MAWCHKASLSVPHINTEDTRSRNLDGFGPVRTPCDGLPMTVRGGGVPAKTTALMPLCRMGPPPRSLLLMRISASWSGLCTHRIQGCGTSIRAPHAGSPRHCHPDHHAEMRAQIRSRCDMMKLTFPQARSHRSAAVLGAVKVWPGNVEYVGRTDEATANLDSPCARPALRIAVGAEESLRRGRTKEMTRGKKVESAVK